MTPTLLFRPILDDELLTRGLGDAEARVLIEWLVERSEEHHRRQDALDVCLREVERLCHRARSLSRFVHLWCHQRLHGAACQLAATQRFAWPLPTTDADPYEVMLGILDWETVSEQQRLELLAA